MTDKEQLNYIKTYISNLKPGKRNDKLINTLPAVNKAIANLDTTNDPLDAQAVKEIKEVTFKMPYVSEHIRANNGTKKDVIKIDYQTKRVKLKEGWFSLSYFYEFD